MGALSTASLGRAHDLGSGDDNEAVLLEVSISARWGPAVGSIPHPGSELPVPPIAEDLDPLVLRVEGGQPREQLRLILRDDDERAFHVAGPRDDQKKDLATPLPQNDGNLRRFVRRGKYKANPPRDPPPRLIAVHLPNVVLLLTDAEYIRRVKRGKWWKPAQATAKRAVAAATP